jgi:hypothetical protein
VRPDLGRRNKNGDEFSMTKKKKDPTNAERSRRWRERQKQRKSAVAESAAVPVVETVAQRPDDMPIETPLPIVAEPVQTAVVPVFDNPENVINFNCSNTPAERCATRSRPCLVTLSATVSALALATVSAGFSITGMTSIFVGSFWPVIGMGIAFELGKLSAVAWLARYRHMAPWRLRTALVALVAVLMALNAIGAYGFLAKAHIGHAVDGDVAVAGLAADIEARIAVQTAVVADLDRRIQQIDRAVDTATTKGRTKGAMELAADQRKARTELIAERTAEAKKLASLQVERAKADGARRKVEADLGPVRYLATLLGAKDDDVLRWFILAVALLLDPAAVLLLAAATRR